MANYGFLVANTGSTLYSGFTFFDSQGYDITINIPPSQTFYVSAHQSITATTYPGLDVQLQGTLDITYDFSACCATDSFSVELPLSLSGFSGSSYYVFYAGFSNSSSVGYGCHNITDGGPSYPYVTALQMDFGVPVSFTDCNDCISTYQCDIEACCLLLGVEYSAGYYYRSLVSEGIVNGRQFYTFTNFSGDSMVMYWDINDWEIDNLTTLTPRGLGFLTTGYCPSFTSTTIDNSSNCLTDLTGLTLNLLSNVVPCSGCSPIYCVNDTGLGYDDTFISAGTHNSETYWTGVTNGYFIYFTIGGTWCLSTTLDGVCLLEGSYPCYSSCPDLCDEYVFDSFCPTPTPSPTTNCSTLDFTAIFDCDYIPTPTPTPTISVTPTPTMTPSSSPLCSLVNVDVTITGYTPTPTATLTPTPTPTPQITRPCNVVGSVVFNTIDGELKSPSSKQFQDCYTGEMYYTTNSIPLPSGGSINQFMVFKALVNGNSKCVSFLGYNLNVIGIDVISLVDGPLGYSNVGQCSLCTPDVSPTPTPTVTPSVTPTLTPTPTPSMNPGYYIYRQCGNPTEYVIQTLAIPTFTVGQVFKTIANDLCWEFVSYSPTYPTLPLGSTFTYVNGSFFPSSGNTFFNTCIDCLGSL